MLNSLAFVDWFVPRSRRIAAPGHPAIMSGAGSGLEALAECRGAGVVGLEADGFQVIAMNEAGRAPDNPDLGMGDFRIDPGVVDLREREIDAITKLVARIKSQIQTFSPHPSRR